jgi:cytochrome c-type biogenesis protein CcmE
MPGTWSGACGGNDEGSRAMAGEGGRRIWILVALGVAAGVIGLLAMSGIGENLVYYWSPSELRAAGERALGATVRLGGVVEAGSIQHATGGLELSFRVTDGVETVPVFAKAVPPAMFREGIGVVVEGRLRPDQVFESSRLMVKHDNEYRPPGEDDERSMGDLVKTLQVEAGEG